MYCYVISFALSTPMTIGLIVSLIFRAYIIISFIYYVCIIAPALISHPFTNMHQKTITIIIYYQNRWSHDSIVEPTYVLMGSPGHYQLGPERFTDLTIRFDSIIILAIRFDFIRFDSIIFIFTIFKFLNN